MLVLQIFVVYIIQVKPVYYHFSIVLLPLIRDAIYTNGQKSNATKEIIINCFLTENPLAGGIMNSSFSNSLSWSDWPIATSGNTIRKNRCFMITTISINTFK